MLPLKYFLRKTNTIHHLPLYMAYDLYFYYPTIYTTCHFHSGLKLKLSLLLMTRGGSGGIDSPFLDLGTSVLENQDSVCIAENRSFFTLFLGKRA